MEQQKEPKLSDHNNRRIAWGDLKDGDKIERLRGLFKSLDHRLSNFSQKYYMIDELLRNHQHSEIGDVLIKANQNNERFGDQKMCASEVEFI